MFVWIDFDFCVLAVLGGFIEVIKVANVFCNDTFVVTFGGQCGSLCDYLC